MKFVAMLGVLVAFQATALTIDEPLEFETKVSVPVANISCLPGPFMMQRLKIMLSSPIGRSDQTGILISGFSQMPMCPKTVEDLKKQAINGEVTLTAKVSQQTVLKLASDGRNKCEGAQQEIITIDVGGGQVSESAVRVEQELDCPAGTNPQWVKTKDGVLLVLHINGVPTAPKQ